MHEEEIFDVTIIGGGPAGLYSAFYSGLRGLRTKIVEYQPKLGGKLHIYAEKMIWDVGGHAPITAGDLIKQMIEQANTFAPAICLGEKVAEIKRNITDNTSLCRLALEAESPGINFTKLFKDIKPSAASTIPAHLHHLKYSHISSRRHQFGVSAV